MGIFYREKKSGKMTLPPSEKYACYAPGYAFSLRLIGYATLSATFNLVTHVALP